MANQWLRLWHDMPNDPKWRTIARASGRTIPQVIAVYCHVIVTASQNVTRGHADVVTEDIASALDMETPDVESIILAMQGRVLEGEQVTGWDRRQPIREDQGSEETGAKSATQRKREERERKAKAEAEAAALKHVTDSHDESRNVTLDKDKDKDKKEEEIKTPAPVVAVTKAPAKAAPKKTRLSESFTISPAVRAWAAEHGHDRLELHLLHFTGYARANGKSYVDWDAALMNAIRDNWAKVGARPGQLTLVAGVGARADLSTMNYEADADGTF